MLCSYQIFQRLRSKRKRKAPDLIKMQKTNINEGIQGNLEKCWHDCCLDGSEDLTDVSIGANSPRSKH